MCSKDWYCKVFYNSQIILQNKGYVASLSVCLYNIFETNLFRNYIYMFSISKENTKQRINDKILHIKIMTCK